MRHDHLSRPTQPNRTAPHGARARTTTALTALIALGSAVLLGGGLIGCQKTAIRPDDTRSQFDRYDQARNQKAQPFLEDEYGRRTPNLKDRLLLNDE